MTENAHQLPTSAPPGWMNASMKVFLKIPGLQSVIGKKIALITFTGRKSGKRYTTPVTYYRDGDTVTILTKKFRAWWRNFDTNPAMELRLAGKTYQGQASATVGDESTLPLLVAFLEHNRQDAKFYNVRIENNKPNMDDVRALLPLVVLVRVTLQ
jgi:deazaflavin-dependent oxidoreductase (nitroreductase family)